MSTSSTNIVIVKMDLSVWIEGFYLSSAAVLLSLGLSEASSEEKLQ